MLSNNDNLFKQFARILNFHWQASTFFADTVHMSIKFAKIKCVNNLDLKLKLRKLQCIMVYDYVMLQIINKYTVK